MSLLIDLAGIGLILANIALGYRYGLLRRGIALAGLYAGVGTAALIGNGVASYFNGSTDPTALYRAGWWFVGIMFAIVVMVEVLALFYGDKVSRVASMMFDRTAGMVMGVFVGFMQVAVVCLVVLSVGQASEANSRSPLPPDRGLHAQAVQDSLLGKPVSNDQSAFLNLFRPVLPKDLPAHLAENTNGVKSP